MVLIFGGAYQGKLDYAKEHYAGAVSVFKCSEARPEIDFTKDIISSFHLFVRASIKSGNDALAFIEENMERLRDKIIISDDISSGVVPIERENRLWREANGRCLTLLAANSNEVIRVFCGMGMRLK